MNVSYEVLRQAESAPQAVAVATANGTVTFGQLKQQVESAARQFCRHGVQKGDVVGLCFDDELALLVAILASTGIGATAFSIPRSLPPSMQKNMASQAGVSVLIADSKPVNLPFIRQIVIDVFRLPNDPGERNAVISVDSPTAPCLIITGSGSTGQPKLFAIEHSQLLARARLLGNTMHLSPSDRVGTLSHLDYLTSKMWWFAALLAGGSVASLDRQQIAPLSIREEFGITVLNTGVVHLEQMLAAVAQAPEHRKTDLRALIVAGSAVSDGLRQRVAARLTDQLWIFYGTNEMGLLTLVAPSEPIPVPGTVGRPATGVQIEIVDARGHVIGNGQTGHVRVRSPWMIDGYRHDAEASKKAFRDGWFYPGDMGWLSDDGQLVYCGRSDHMMNMNGINIYPAEIELTMSQHEAVRDVAVIPAHSAIHQDLPVCALTLHPSSGVSEMELYNFARQQLGPRMPRFIFVLPEIPRNEQGKLIRAKLRETVEERLRQMQGRADSGKPGETENPRRSQE